MDKLLMIGNDSVFFRNTYEMLAESYNVHFCEFDTKQIQRNVKILKPSIILCFKPADASNVSLMEAREEFVGIRMIIVCEASDNSLQGIPLANSIVVKQPLKLTDIAQKISDIQNTAVESDRKPRILAVDDNGMMLRNIKQIIGSNYEVDFANSGMKALETMNKKAYDLVLLDYEMPQMSGCDVLEEIRANDKLKDIPVVFLTGISDRERILEVISYQPAGYLLKPLDSQMLMDKLKEILG